MTLNDLRIGQGIDIHPFVKGRDLILAGVKIPYERGLLGHSDADVLAHAVIDAILGAAGRGDIGTQFPDTDPQWKNADSLLLLEKVWASVRSEGWEIGNLDCTLLAQVPKISPYVPQMKQNLCRILGIETSACGMKASTSEKLGFVGREEGIMALAVVLLKR